MTVDAAEAAVLMPRAEGTTRPLLVRPVVLSAGHLHRAVTSGGPARKETVAKIEEQEEEEEVEVARGQRQRHQPVDGPEVVHQQQQQQIGSATDGADRRAFGSTVGAVVLGAVIVVAGAEATAAREDSGRALKTAVTVPTMIDIEITG